MISSETRPPLAMMSLTCRPSGEPALTAARSMSPVETVDGELLGDEASLGTFTGTGRPQQNHAIVVLLRAEVSKGVRISRSGHRR